ncbi:TetR/AcrR family transcriptional regulator [Streptomyces sp. NPDC047981]|uniref:TetR/AcrR family transcriptional regulator n=1 Tax=Streptomyces sp. NPDC047981 TaxID=3154610 RepID=UPI00341D3FBF
MVRMEAAERRESVIAAALAEFSRNGYYGTSTYAIAKRVGVSQSYLFRLFPGKRAIFLAVVERCTSDLKRVLEEAGRGLSGEKALLAMADAYSHVIAEDPDRLLMQLQVYVTVAAADSAGDHEFGQAVRAGWMRLWDTVHHALDADTSATMAFLAYGIHVALLKQGGSALDMDPNSLTVLRLREPRGFSPSD